MKQTPRNKVSLKDIFEGKIKPFSTVPRNTNKNTNTIAPLKFTTSESSSSSSHSSTKNNNPPNKFTKPPFTKKPNKMVLSKKNFFSKTLDSYQFGSKHYFTSADYNSTFYDAISVCLCKCGTPCQTLKVTVDTPNKGKFFMKCANEKKNSTDKWDRMCDFFKFKDSLEDEIKKAKDLNQGTNKMQDVDSLIVNYKMCSNDKLMEETFPMSDSIHNVNRSHKNGRSNHSKPVENQVIKSNPEILDQSLMDAFSDEIPSIQQLKQDQTFLNKENNLYKFDTRNYDIQQVSHNIRPTPRSYENQATQGNILMHNYLFEERKGNHENKVILEKLKDRLKMMLIKFSPSNEKTQIEYCSIYQQIYEHTDIIVRCNQSPFDSNQGIYNSVEHRIYMIPYQRYKNSNLPKNQQITEIDIQGNRIDDKGFIFDGHSNIVAIHWEDETNATDCFYLVWRHHMAQFLDYHVDWTKNTTNDGFKFLNTCNMKSNISTDSTNIIYQDKTIESQKKTKEQINEDCLYRPHSERKTKDKEDECELCTVFDTKKEHVPKFLLNTLMHPYFVGHNRKAVGVSKLEIETFWKENNYFLLKID